MNDEHISRASEYITEEIVKDLSDRRGLRQEWDNIDYDIQEEIKDNWKSIIRDVLKEY